MRFSQVDVFSAVRFLGNALAVVHDADGLSEADMARIARWTNLSETTFLLRPTMPGADYRVRIWTTGGELPFAGHPTIGSAHAWLEAGGRPAAEDAVVQECGVGLVTVRRDDRLAFAAPPLLRGGAVAADLLARIVRALRVGPGDVVDAAWCDNGPGWVGLLLRSAEAVLAVDPDVPAFEGLKVGVVGPYTTQRPHPDGCAVEVRAFYADGRDFSEDPVTGSLNASLAQWLIGNGTLPAAYVASQGTALHRRGRVHIATDGDTVWVGGDAVTCLRGDVTDPAA